MVKNGWIIGFFSKHLFTQDKKVEKQKLSFKTDFYGNIEMKKFLYSTPVSLSYCIRKARRVCAGGSERIKTLILGVSKKINKQFAG